MKDYLQPAATFALALAIASLPFTNAIGSKAMSARDATGFIGSIDVYHQNSCN